MRAFHRALRRAELPVRMTEGFNPRPRVVFPHALEVGVPSDDEVVEIELSAWVAPAEFARRLAAELPPGLVVREVRLCPPRRQAAVALEAHYEATLDDSSARAARDGIGRFMAAQAWPFERKLQDGTVRALDLRPHVLGLELNGSTLGLLGAGRIGSAVGRRAAG